MSNVFDPVAWSREQERLYSLPIKDPEHPLGFHIEPPWLSIYWGGYEYPIALEDLKQHHNVLRWLHHLGKKQWAGMTPSRVSRLIGAISKFNGWDIYGNGGPPSRETSADAERAKLTPSLRFRVLKRDGFRCRTCGSGPETGALLHIDHIVAIAKGGLTEFANLQALCATCNLGKRDT